jgi:opacity protein-like surface antigen
MKTTSSIWKLLLVVTAGLALYVPAAQARDRGNGGAGSWEFSMPINYTKTSTVTGQSGSSADINAGLSTGLGLGYNVNDNFQVTGKFNWGQRNYSANTTGTGTIGPYNGTLYSSTLELDATYYFMPGDFTPFVSGGFGSTFIDSNIPNGGSSSSCYWDPWWGYVCGTYQPTKTSTNITYNFGAGMRMDLSRNFALQGSINRMWIDAARTGSTPEFDSFRIDFIFRM